MLHCFHAFSNKLCLLSTPLGIYTQFRKTNALFMIAISTAWLYTYQLNSSFAFFILFLPITTCSYKCLTNMHWVFYTAFNGEHLNGFHKVNEAVINNTAGKPVKRLHGRNYREENVLGMYFPYEISGPVHICKIYMENYSSTVWKYLCFWDRNFFDKYLPKIKTMQWPVRNAKSWRPVLLFYTCLLLNVNWRKHKRNI